MNRLNKLEPTFCIKICFIFPLLLDPAIDLSLLCKTNARQTGLQFVHFLKFTKSLSSSHSSVVGGIVLFFRKEGKGYEQKCWKNSYGWSWVKDFYFLVFLRWMATKLSQFKRIKKRSLAVLHKWVKVCINNEAECVIVRHLMHNSTRVQRLDRIKADTDRQMLTRLSHFDGALELHVLSTIRSNMDRRGQWYKH